jgi:hypothetical protein
MLAFFRGKFFAFCMPDHAKPGCRHVVPHVFLMRIVFAVRHPAALCRVGSIFVRLTHDLAAVCASIDSVLALRRS